MSNQYPTPRTNLPIVAALAAAVILMVLVVGAVVMLSLGKALDETTTPLVVSLIGVVVTAVPALIGAAFSERASKDIRNGTLVAKAKEGAALAIEERVPTIARESAAEAIDEKQVMTRTGPVVTAELLALTKILGHIDRLDAASHSTEGSAPPG